MIIAAYVLGTLIFTSVCLYIQYYLMRDQYLKTFDANVQGFLLTKSDRINYRIENFKATVKTQNSTIAVSDFLKFVKSLQIMIAQELTYKGIVGGSHGKTIKRN